VSPTVCGLPEEVQVDEKLAVVSYITTEAMTHISTASVQWPYKWKDTLPYL